MPFTKEQVSAAISNLVHSVDVVEFSVDLMKNLDLLANQPLTLFYELVKAGKTEFFQRLLSKKEFLDINIHQLDEILTYLINNPDLHKKAEFVKILLNSPYDNDDYAAFLKKLLTEAIDKNDNELFYILIDLRAVKLIATDNPEDTPLIHATALGNLPFAKALLNKDLVIEQLTGTTSICYEHINRLTEIIFEKAQVTQRFTTNGLQHNFTPEWLEFIKTAFEKLNLRQGYLFRHPFVCFCEREKRPSLIEAILNANIFDIDYSAGGKTLALKAAEFDNIELLKSLRNRGVDFNKGTCYDPKVEPHDMPLHHINSLDALEIILPETDDKYLAQNEYRLLHYVMNNTYNSTSHSNDIFFQRLSDLIKSLITKEIIYCKAEKNILHELSFIHSTSSIGEDKITILIKEIFEKIIDLGVDIPKLLVETDSSGFTPICRSISGNRLSLFKILLEKEIENDIISLNDGDLLSFAIELGHVEIVKHILSLGPGSKNSVSPEALLESITQSQDLAKTSELSSEQEQCIKLLVQAAKKLQNFAETSQLTLTYSDNASQNLVSDKLEKIEQKPTINIPLAPQESSNPTENQDESKKDKNTRANSIPATSDNQKNL